MSVLNLFSNGKNMSYEHFVLLIIQHIEEEDITGREKGAVIR